jgi:hypothetical protein
MWSKGDIKIMCGKCHKQVDALTAEYNMYTDTKTYTAICHGEEEKTVLTGMDSMMIYEIEGATAFVQPLALEDHHD